jgi:hypothetical protein
MLFAKGDRVVSNRASAVLASAMPDALPAIPLIDARNNPLVLADPAGARALRDAAFGALKPIVLPALPMADRIARRWLKRGPSPYLAELDAVAAHTRIAGVYAINVSYESGCTTLARADDPGRAPTLRRTLDWPYRGLGRSVVVAHRAGPVGGFFDVTWPGAIGTLTAVAPRRFAASINQAPLYRRTRANVLRAFDYAANLARTLARERGMPPLHLLRHVFETAETFSDALAMLRTIEIARPALFTLIGPEPEQFAVIERREREATVHLGPGSVANDWRDPHPSWEPRRCALIDHKLDSAARRRGIEEAADGCAAPFGWVVPPVRNWNTRLAVEMNAGEGWLNVLGFEPCSSVDAAPATLPFVHRVSAGEAASAAAVA